MVDVYLFFAMETFFGSEFFAGNRQKLRTLFAGTAPIVITANGLLQRSSDDTFPLRQDRNFWYLTGIDEPDAILVMDKSREYLILSEEHVHRMRFDGAQSIDDIVKISGITEVLDNKTGWQQLKYRVKKVKHLATLAASPAYVPFYAFYSNPARATLIGKMKDINSSIELLDLTKHLNKMRITKQPIELEAIGKAIAITEKTLKSVSRKTWTDQNTELDIDRELKNQFSRHGADDLAFNNVVAAGSNTAVIHHKPDMTKLPKNGLVLLDVGAEYDHYAADISRVYAFGNPTKRMRQVFSCAQAALEQALDMLKPGLIHRQFEDAMEHVVGEKLRELGLIKTIDRESVRKYFPTYTSHQLGLDAHDTHDYDSRLEEGMVLAVEPGIYIPEEGIGIRIEDDVLITAKGVKVLSNGLPRTLS